MGGMIDGCMFVCMGGWMDAWVDGWTDEWITERINYISFEIQNNLCCEFVMFFHVYTILILCRILPTPTLPPAISIRFYFKCSIFSSYFSLLSEPWHRWPIYNSGKQTHLYHHPASSFRVLMGVVWAFPVQINGPRGNRKRNKDAKEGGTVKTSYTGLQKETTFTSGQDLAEFRWLITDRPRDS